MPRLGDEPSIDVEDINAPQDDVLPGSIGEMSKDDVDDDGDDDKSDTKVSKKVKKRSKTHVKTVSGENAANFGNNVKTKPGINPSAAFLVKEENHEGFRGKDKTVTASKKSKTGKVGKTGKSKNLTKGSSHKDDKDIISKIKDITKELNDVEAKKKKIKQQIAKNKKKRKQTSTDLKNILVEDGSTMNSHGRNQTTQLLVNKPKGK